MRILYLAHRIPYPPDKGDKIRSFNTIKHLSRRHDVWCVCFVDDPRDMRHVGALRAYCQDVVAIPLRRWKARLLAALNLAIDESASAGYYHDQVMTQALRSLSSRVGFDALLVYSSGMGLYADDVAAGCKVIDLCDRDSCKWQQMAGMVQPPRSWLLAAEAHRLAELEDALAGRFDAVTLIGEHEAAGWTGCPPDRLHIISNGVDLPDNPTDVDPGSNTIIFVGDMAYAPNQDAVCWFAEEIWPCVLRKCPGTLFQIVGRSPSRPVRRLTRHAGIQVTGEVDDVAPYLRRCRCVVAPLRIARGVQNKVLEAMAHARPVVATSAAAQGIDAADGSQFIIADDPRRFADAVTQLMQDAALANRIGAAARNRVARRYRWQSQLQPLDSILDPRIAASTTHKPCDTSVLVRH